MESFRVALYKIIGEKIKSKREELKITQLELSESLNISRASVSNIEVGRHQIPLVVLYSISQVLKIDIQELIPSYKEVSDSIQIFDYIEHIDRSKFDDDELDSIKNIIINI
ncbi:helix-turn-helix domain-containing protein [Apibacter sp. B2912]|uniref:helix-turn-helix domain-containing protein n=1 Tax=Apibacter sp. B2912 TaxID=2656763 RepID=UPI00137127DA|nr:helix-turn-helix transcriptional regulator [Apibacter sp. B2912]MXO31614.1 helix-turn-helix domain-containing protein [Apibacter sp. B2912]